MKAPSRFLKPHHTLLSLPLSATLMIPLLLLTNAPNHVAAADSSLNNFQQLGPKAAVLTADAHASTTQQLGSSTADPLATAPANHRQLGEQTFKGDNDNGKGPQGPHGCDKGNGKGPKSPKGPDCAWIHQPPKPRHPPRLNINLLTLPSLFWGRVQSKMLDVLASQDLTLTCQKGGACPCNPAATNGTDACVLTFNQVCGAIARSWFRSLFHDAATYDKSSRTGGADGSLQFELDRPENPFGLVIQTYSGILKNTTTEVRACAPWAPLPKGGMADAIVLGGFLGFAVCGGPGLPVTTGRTDATCANAEGKIPSRDASGADVLAAFARMGLNARETVAVIGAGHTIASLNGESLDSSSQAFDNKFFKEVVAKSGAPFTLHSDASLSQTPEAAPFFKKWAKDENFFDWMGALTFALRKMASLGQPPFVF